MRMVCVALAMQLAVLVPSPVTTVSLVLPTSLFWWVRDADRNAPVAPLFVMECAVLAMSIVLSAGIPLSSVLLVRVISPSFVDRNVCRTRSSNCITCSGPNTCLSCPASLPFLESGVCVACPPGQSLNNGQCQATVTPSPSFTPSPAPVAPSASSAIQRSNLPPPPPAEVVQPSFRPANPVVTPSESRTPVTPTPVFSANRDYVIIIANQDEDTQNSASVASLSVLLVTVLAMISIVF